MEVTMIEVNGHIISTIVVSTIMGHYGDGMFPLYFRPSYQKAKRAIKETNTTILTKSSTAFKWMGNYNKRDLRTWGCIRDIPDMGMVNAFGLTNDGAEKCAIGIESSIKKGFNVIPNYFPQFGDDDELTLRQARKAISTFADKLKENFWAIEFNLSCPNDKRKIEENIAKAVRFVNQIKISFPWLTIIAKTSIVHPYEFLQELETAGVDILHLVNSVPYDTIFSDESPVSKYGIGGVSGGPAFEPAIKYTSGASKITRVRLIAGCGITDFKKFHRYREETRAESFSICTGLKRNTKEMTKLIEIHN